MSEYPVVHVPREPEQPKAKGGGFGKVDSVTMAARIEVVLDLIVQGWTVNAICRFQSGVMTDKDGRRIEPEGGPWNLTRRQVERYVKTALGKLATASDIARVDKITLARRRFEHIIARGLAVGDLAVAERATRSIARLDGLEAPRVVSVSGNIDHTGTVEHEHTHRAATIEERAGGVRKLFELAAERKKRGQHPTPIEAVVDMPAVG